tara:strand:- start:353 stop:580 length:228 start_codon:yes stop_codon:yes gene_type:complete
MFYERYNLLVNDLTNKKVYIYDSKFLFKNNYYNIKNENDIEWFIINILKFNIGNGAWTFNEFETVHKNKLNQNKD